MVGVQDAVHDGVAQVEVGGGHVDFGAQGAGAVRKLAGAHALEQIEVLFHRAVAVGALLAGLGERTAKLADFFRGQIAHVGLAGFDELDGPLIQLIEIVGGVEAPVLPIEAEPVDVVDDGIDVLGLFLAGIGVVEPQVGLAAELGREAEVEADGFGVADVQVAVGLGRKAGVHAPAVLVGFQVFEDDVADEISRTGCRIHNSFSLAMAWSIRRRQVSRPRTSRVPKGAARSCGRTRPRGQARTSGRP